MSSSVDAPAAAHQAAVYLNCPRCGLSIEMRSRWLAIRHCPRCVTRAHTAVELFSSGLPSSVLYASDSLPQADRKHTPVNRRRR
jgi:hypothetical protein